MAGYFSAARAVSGEGIVSVGPGSGADVRIRQWQDAGRVAKKHDFPLFYKELRNLTGDFLNKLR